MNEEQILKNIDSLERERMEYLEVNDKRSVRRIDLKIEKLNLQLEILRIQEIKQELKYYKRFIQDKELEYEFKQMKARYKDE